MKAESIQRQKWKLAERDTSGQAWAALSVHVTDKPYYSQRLVCATDTFQLSRIKIAANDKVSSIHSGQLAYPSTHHFLHDVSSRFLHGVDGSMSSFHAPRGASSVARMVFQSRCQGTLSFAPIAQQTNWVEMRLATVSLCPIITHPLTE